MSDGCDKCGEVTEHTLEVIDHGMFWMTLERIFNDGNLDGMGGEVFKSRAEITFWMLVQNAPGPHDGSALSPEYYLIAHTNTGIMTWYYDPDDDTLKVAK